MKQIDWNQVKQYIDDVSDASSIYLGCDSERFRKNGLWHATYTTVIVVHKDSNNGCKLFGESITERDYDQNHKKPALRLMNEVYKVTEAYSKLHQIVGDRNFKVSIHLDINPDEQFGSNCVINQAVGYIKGITGIDPDVKPNAMAASFAADQYNYRCNLNQTPVK